MRTLHIGKVAGIAVGIATLYLIIYVVLVRSEMYFSLSLFMFAISPVVLIGMVYCILKYGKHYGRALKEGEEWGYDDRP